MADKSHTNFCDEFEFETMASRETHSHANANKKSDATLHVLFGDTPLESKSSSEVKEWDDTTDTNNKSFEGLFGD